MIFYRLAISVLLLFTFTASEAAINCEPLTTTTYNYNQWAQMHSTFDIAAADVNTTLGQNISDWAVLYTAFDVVIGNDSGTCNASGILDYLTMLTQLPSIGHQGSDYIYATDVPGIGISVSGNGGGGSGSGNYPYTSMQPYPWAYIPWDHQANGIGFHAIVKYWKIPNQNIPLDAGAITVTGPEYAVIYKKSGNSFTSSDHSRITSDGMAYINGSRIIVGTLIFKPGTCNIEGDNINVEMGDYDGANGASAWKDASFKLVCPTAYGYNGGTKGSSAYSSPFSIHDYSITSNTQKNGKVEISIVPLNSGAIDPTRGIIALDGTGAQGYGIQLAWGDYSTQNATEPANPVILNSYIDANSLNFAFRSEDTPIGKNAFIGGDNTIKMAARYIRTSGDAAPGPANAVVQVIATYQ